MPNARVPFFRTARRLRLRSCLRPPSFYFIFYARSHALSRTSRSLPAADRSKAEEKREKNGTSGVHGGGYVAPHDTNSSFWILDLIFILAFYFTDGPSLT
jgi:hypothetical protein